jgi:hypothetical protein
MDLIRGTIGWIIGRFLLFVVLGIIIFLGLILAPKLGNLAKFKDYAEVERMIAGLRETDQRITKLAMSASADAQNSLKELDQASGVAIQSRIKALEVQINQRKTESPSALEKTKAISIGHSESLSRWIGNAILIQTHEAEKKGLEQILDYRSKLEEFERSTRSESERIEQLRLDHLGLLGKFEQLGSEIDKLKADHPVLVNVPGSPQSLKLDHLQSQRRNVSGRTHELKREHEKLSEGFTRRRKPQSQVSVIQVKADAALHDLKKELARLENTVQKDWTRRLYRFMHESNGKIKLTALAAANLVAMITLMPVLIRLIFYYLLAPIAARRPGVMLDERDSGEVLLAGEATDQNSSGPNPISSVSCNVTIDDSNELLVHSDHLQSSPAESEAQTQWLLDSRFPLSSLASGLYGLTRLRSQTRETVVVSSTLDPHIELAQLTLPSGSSLVLLPRHIVGVLQPRATPLRISGHWRLFNLHAWLTLRFRYFVFHGPVTLVVKGCRGVRLEDAQAGRSFNPATQIGFSPSLSYSSRRCETFLAYHRGKQALLNDSFTNNRGSCVHQGMPYRGRGGSAKFRLEGIIDALLKPFGL